MINEPHSGHLQRCYSNGFSHSLTIIYPCRIPSGTSPELTALLQGLLRRNAKDRMEFDDFFNHPFIRKSHPPPTTPPLPVPNLARLSTPPKSPPVTVPSRPITTNPGTQNNNAPTPEEADDFVLVPSPSQLRTGADVVGRINQNEGDTQPLPVPSQRDAFLKVCQDVHLEKNFCSLFSLFSLSFYFTAFGFNK